MHKSDYLAQVEALRASPELRARVAGLAGTPARRRRLRPWMGVCACLAVLLLGGTLLLPRLGGSSAGGGGHAGGSIFQSYAGPVFPLTTLEDAGLTARRTITLDFAPWGDGHTTDIDVTDSYVLTNPTDTDQSVTLVYPFSGSFYALYPPTLTADGAALDAVIRPGVGGSQSLESWEEYAALVEGNDLAAAHAEIHRPGHAGDGLRLHRPHPAGERRCGPHPGGDLPLVGGRPRRADLRLSRQLH